MLKTNIVWDEIDHFDPKIDDMIPCPCCQTAYVDEEFIQKLSIAREVSGTPYKVNSMCRCFDYDKFLKKKLNLLFTGKSSHLFTPDQKIKTCAVDLKVENSHERFKIIEGLIFAGFQRIIIYRNFIHVDSDKRKASKLILLG